jgi:hypothetical protein
MFDFLKPPKSKNNKICKTCQSEKPIEKFYRNAKAKDGRSGVCAECCAKNSKRKNPFKYYNGKRKEVEPDIKPTKVTYANNPKAVRITKEEANTISTLLKKLDCFFVISIQKNGKCELKQCGNPSRIFKAQSPEELIEMVMDS